MERHWAVVVVIGIAMFHLLQSSTSVQFIYIEDVKKESNYSFIG